MSFCFEVVIYIFAIIGATACLCGIVRTVEWLCDNCHKVQLLWTRSEDVYSRIETILHIVESQQDEIKLLKERIDIYEKSNNKSNESD